MTYSKKIKSKLPKTGLPKAVLAKMKKGIPQRKAVAMTKR